MGNFYTNVTLVGTRAGAAAARMRELGRTAFVADAGDDCVVDDRQCDEQRALGLPAAAVGTGFTYIERDELPPGLTPDRIQRV